MITNITIFVLMAQIASVDGLVRDAQNRKALPMVRVELLYAGVPSATEYTDPEGRFHFGNVFPGSYAISAAFAGYATKSMEFDTTMSGPFEIDLTRTVEHPQPGSPVISVREYMMPDAARKEFDQAQKDIKRQDCGKAIAHLEKGLRLFDEADALNDLGNCYRRLGKLDSAEASFRRAIELSDSVYIALNLGDVYTAQKQFNEARTVLERALARTSVNGDAYYGIALTYFKEQRFDEAETAAQQAHTRPHRIADVHLLLAMIYAKKTPGKVVGQLELYLDEAPNGPQSEHVRQVLKTVKRNQYR